MEQQKEENKTEDIQERKKKNNKKQSTKYKPEINRKQEPKAGNAQRKDETGRRRNTKQNRQVDKE